MKLRTLILVILGSVLVLAVAAVALALTPGVQTWAVRMVLSGQPDADITVGRVAAGFSGAEVTEFRISQPGMSAKADRVVVRYSATGLLFSKKIDLDEVTVEGVELDLRNQRTAPSSSPAGGPRPASGPAPTSPSTAPARPSAGEQAPFEGILKSVTLPEGFRVGRVVLQGSVLLPDAQSATLSLQGGNLAAGSEAALTWSVAFADQSPGASLRAVRSEGRGAATIANDGGAERLSADLTVVFDGDDLPSDRLRTALSVSRANASTERFEIRLARLAAAAEEPLVSLDGTFDTATGAVDGAWRVTLQGPSVAALLAGLSLPELAMEGEGAFGVQTRAGAFHASGRAQGSMDRLAVLSPALEAVEAVRFDTRFEVRGDEAEVRLAGFELTVTTPAGVSLATIRTLQPVTFSLADQSLAFANADADLGRVALQAVPLAWAQPFLGALSIGRGTLTLDFAVGATADGGRVAVRAEQPLAIRDLDLRGPDGPLAEGAALTVYPKIDYADGRLRAELSRLDLSLAAGDRASGTMRADVADVFTNPAAAFSGELQGRLVTLHTPHVPIPTGPLDFSAAFEGDHAGSGLVLRKTDAVVRREGDVLLAEVNLRSPFGLNLETFAFTQTPGLAAGVKLGRIPLDWVEPFVENLDLAGEVTGGVLEIAVTSPTELTASTLSPVTLAKAGVVLDGEALASDLDAEIDFTASLRGTALTYDVRRLSLSQGDAPVATIKAAGDLDFGGEALRVNTRGELGADAATALRQPVLASYGTLARGRVDTAFELGLADGLRTKASVKARQLVARAENRALGDVDLTATLELRPDGSGSVNLPLKVSAGGNVSDLSIDGRFSQGDKGLSFDGKVSGQKVVVDDLQAFALLAPSSPSPAPSAPVSTPASPPATRPASTGGAARPAAVPVVRDEKPFWSGVAGRIDTDLKEVKYGPETTLGNVRGAFVLADTRLALENLEGRLNNNPFKMNGAVTFDGRQPKPYALAGTADVTELDLGALLVAANPREKPAVETKVTANGRMTGAGANLDDLIQHVQGTFDVKGSSGVLRALGRRGEAVGALSAIVGIIGAQRGSATTVATAELASQLNEMRFDSVVMKIERGADLDLKLTSLEFLSPTSRVTGTGVISHREGTPFTKQPLRLQLALAGKGALAQILNRAGLLDGRQDDREYLTLSRAFSISGTPLAPDSGDLWRFVTEAALRAATTPRSSGEQSSGQEGGTGQATGSGQPSTATPR